MKTNHRDTTPSPSASGASTPLWTLCWRSATSSSCPCKATPTSSVRRARVPLLPCLVVVVVSSAAQPPACLSDRVWFLVATHATCRQSNPSLTARLSPHTLLFETHNTTTTPPHNKRRGHPVPAQHAAVRLHADRRRLGHLRLGRVHEQQPGIAGSGAGSDGRYEN